MEYINFDEFHNTIYDEELQDYINGNIIVRMKMQNKSINENNEITKNIIIDYYLHSKNIKSSKENYKIYSELYDKIFSENKITQRKPIIPYYKTEEYLNDNKEYIENKEWEEEKKLHYNAYFGRYKDLLYIIDYYNKIREEEENKVYNIEEEYEEEEFSDYESDYDYNEELLNEHDEEQNDDDDNY
tara:strand:- start:7464 stop:8021 length:558 start_codon:yes stop_codon:yes gene_type:complete